MRANVKWTNLTHQEMLVRLAADHGIAVSVMLVKRLLGQHDFVRRKPQKRKQTGKCANGERSCEDRRLKEERPHVALVS